MLYNLSVCSDEGYHRVTETIVLFVYIIALLNFRNLCDVVQVYIILPAVPIMEERLTSMIVMVGQLSAGLDTTAHTITSAVASVVL